MPTITYEKKLNIHDIGIPNARFVPSTITDITAPAGSDLSVNSAALLATLPQGRFALVLYPTDNPMAISRVDGVAADLDTNVGRFVGVGEYVVVPISRGMAADSVTISGATAAAAAVAYFIVDMRNVRVEDLPNEFLCGYPVAGEALSVLNASNIGITTVAAEIESAVVYTAEDQSASPQVRFSTDPTDDATATRGGIMDFSDYGDAMKRSAVRGVWVFGRQKVVDLTMQDPNAGPSAVWVEMCRMAPNKITAA